MSNSPILASGSAAQKNYFCEEEFHLRASHRKMTRMAMHEDDAEYQSWGDTRSSSDDDDDSVSHTSDILSDDSRDSVGELLRTSSVNVQRSDIQTVLDRSDEKAAAGLSASSKADVLKGRAVKKQRLVYEKVLNSRIRLQSALVATNSLPRAIPMVYQGAEQTALMLWHSLNVLKRDLAIPKTAHALNTPGNSSSELWASMHRYEGNATVGRDHVLDTWSRKTAPQDNLQGHSLQRQPILEVLSRHMNPSKLDSLVQKSRVPSDCAPVQVAESLQTADIYDDAEFYHSLLTELIGSRNAASKAMGTASTFQKRPKSEKKVDTKASKGRKLRYNIHEKLQNFMAPEDRTKWTVRQSEEFFATILGRELAAKHVTHRSEADNEAEALRLFRS